MAIQFPLYEAMKTYLAGDGAAKEHQLTPVQLVGASLILLTSRVERHTEMPIGFPTKMSRAHLLIDDKEIAFFF